LKARTLQPKKKSSVRKGFSGGGPLFKPSERKYSVPHPTFPLLTSFPQEKKNVAETKSANQKDSLTGTLSTHPYLFFAYLQSWRHNEK
jgi:hypothetical protein